MNADGRLRVGYDARFAEVTFDIQPLTRGIAVVGQSGCGKSFLLGRIAEELICRTENVRVLVIDTNSDFRFGLVPVSAPEFRRRIAQCTSGARSAQATSVRDAELQDFGEYVAMPDVKTGQVFGRRGSPYNLDWARVTDSVWAFVDQVRGGEANASYLLALGRLLSQFQTDNWLTAESTREALQVLVKQQEKAPPDFPFRSEALDMLLADVNREVGIGEWRPAGEAHGLPERLFAESRLNVLDVGALNEKWRLEGVLYVLREHYRERREAAARVRDLLQDRKRLYNREIAKLGHTFIIVDEAHVYAPRPARSPHGEALGDLLQSIASEGRKYGLHLVLATQRPNKVREGLLGECDNAVVMKMNSKADLEFLSQEMRILDVKLLEVCTRFTGVGRAVAVGEVTGMAPNVWEFRAAPRRSKEGGTDIPVS